MGWLRCTCARCLRRATLTAWLPALLQLRENIVGREQGKELVMEVPNRGIWGTAGVGGWNIDRAIDNVGEYDTVTKTADRLDTVVQEEVLLMKVGRWVAGRGWVRCSA